MTPLGEIALTGAIIFRSPVDEPIRNGVLIIQEEKITAVGSRADVQIPPAAQILDCSELTIAAGFWNSHVHFFERKWSETTSIPATELGHQLREMLTQYGFTSVFDIGSMWANTRGLRDRIASGEVPGPRIRSTGEVLVPPGALPPDIVLSMMGTMKISPLEIADPAQAAAAARKMLDQGVDGVKLFASSPRSVALSESTIEAAANEAHRSGKPVFVHTNTGADVLTSVRGGADIIAHTTPHSGPWDETILGAMKERGVALTPTLTLWNYYMRHDRISTQEHVTATAVAQLRAWLDLGGEVLFGTDLGAVDYDPSTEYELMAQAGMNFRQILASLTTAPAERFGESVQLGRIAPGLQADLVVLQGDPSTDLRALTAVKYTICRGRIVYQN